MPGYNINTLPFFFIRDRKGISIANVNNGNGWTLIQSIFNYEPGNTKRLEVYEYNGTL
jgi:hypothetical protein